MLQEVEIQGDVARQAVSSLKGYAYQLYESALAWTTLAKDEFLFLEVAEDYAFASSNSLQAVQVKDVAKAITLNSKEVIDTINSFFQLSKLNPDKSISIKHLTTANIGMEKATSDRINGQSGLLYWKSVQAGADAGPLIKRISMLDLSEDAAAFLKSATPERIRADFLNRVEWLGGSEDIETLRSELGNRLVYLGEAKNVPSSLCDDMVDPLLSKVLTAAISKGSRRLERADFVRFFDERSRVSLPIAAVEQFLNPVTTSPHGFVSSVAILRPVAAIDPSNLAGRHVLSDKIQLAIAQQKIAWLHGATGTGKSSLAKLAASNSGGDWRTLQLRSLGARDTTEALYRATSQIAIDKPTGVVLDDLGSLASGLSKEAFAHLIASARKATVSVLVTSNLEVPNFSLTGSTPIIFESINVGNLTEDEVAAFITAKGGNSKEWARYVYLATGGGHPLLVDAMIRGLSVKSWPVQELQQLSGILGADEDIERVKSEARKRLFDELTPDASTLIVRLSLVLGTFDRNLAMYIGELDPAIAMPGRALEGLVGPWIEVEAEDRYRLSSLMSNAGQHALGSKASEKLHHSLADYYTRDWRLDAARFDDIILHGLIGKNEKALTAASLAVISASADDVEQIARINSNAAAFRTDQPLYPENPTVSLYLRIAQVLLLVSSKRPKKFQEALDAVERESAGTSSVAASARTFGMVYIKAMSQPGLVEVVDDLPKFALNAVKYAEKLEISPSETQTWTSGPISSVEGYLHFMFAFQLGQISDFETLKRVMRRLIKKNKKQREFLLEAFDSTYFDKSLIVKTVWAKSFQGAETVSESDAEQYLNLARELANADETGFAMAAFESAAVIWDEYIQNPERAISCLEEAKSQLGENQAATRALSRILFHKHDYERQLAVGMPLSEEFIAGSTEASFFLRELAIGASRLGKHEAAKELFEKANRQIVDDPAKGITPMAAGLLADAAVEAHWTGNSAEAVKLFAQALEAADTLNPEDGLQSAAAIRLIAHSVVWLSLQVEGETNPFGEHIMISGANSNPTPHEELEGAPELSLDYVWYVLATTEAALDADGGVIDKLLSNGWSKRAVLISEATFYVRIAQSAQRRLSTDDYLAYLPRAIDSHAFVQKEGRDMGNGVLRIHHERGCRNCGRTNSPNYVVATLKMLCLSPFACPFFVHRRPPLNSLEKRKRLSVHLSPSLC
ncbi:tetratricopeptide repeat protein [Martelella soudanensis]|uniref:tetratricopeptide repeat protein n=1 Tax=Martelella sp. NC18 TaxID=2740297 RepID=UPI0015DD9F3C|nr:tetratricopeptide repeat protein [Martelella sp. NC18]